MRLQYFTCDVFTNTRFGGNPLAVLPKAEGLSDRQMQRIAREFNYSETTFVFPPTGSATRGVRIFTPESEVPFAGHPNIGTAFVLASTEIMEAVEENVTIRFEEQAGEVPVTIARRDGDTLWCELLAPERVSFGAEADPARLAAALGLEADDIVTTRHQPREVSVGLPVLITELKDRSALERVRLPVTEELAATGVSPLVYVYTRSGDEVDIRARMFAPLAGVSEDPATGSAGCALAGLLGYLDDVPDGTYRWRIAQGVEMGRPSLLEVSAEKRNGEIVATGVGGTCVLVGEGVLYLD